ncbi:MAG: alcohol dehydrogenase catalytic domain-containing protein [Desulfosarcinaceae bacterium]|nr:alcohol dehydrogenase catalytic domain-containing protein [Desulfosarcinaceae bacterium]
MDRIQINLGREMTAAVLEDRQSIRLQRMAIPQPAAGEVLVKINLGGICGSDRSAYEGKIGAALPVIPGHEAVGRVARVGDAVSGLDKGQRVTIQPNFACNSCRLCHSGHGNICGSKVRLGVDIDGVFAEYVKVPARYLWPIPAELTDEIAVFTEPLAVCLHAMRQIPPTSGIRILIFGAGVIGLLTTQLAAREGAQVTAIDLSENRLALARQLGASQTISPDQPLDAHYDQFDVIYETSGATVALDQAIRLATDRGRICLLGLPGSETPVLVDLIVRKELQIRGSMIYTDEFPDALKHLQAGHIQTPALATDIIPLKDLADALAAFRDPGRVKTLVRI